MRRLGPRLIVAAMVIVYLASAVLIEVLHARSGQVDDDPAGTIALLLAFSAYMATGVMVILRRPGNVMGWILSSIALLVMIGALAGEYVVYALEAGMGDAPALIPAAWLAEWYWFPTLALVLFFTPLLFPDGRPVNRRWRPVLWLGIAVTGLIAAMAALCTDPRRARFLAAQPDRGCWLARCRGQHHWQRALHPAGRVDPRCGCLGGGALSTIPRRRTATAEVVHDLPPWSPR